MILKRTVIVLTLLFIFAFKFFPQTAEGEEEKRARILLSISYYEVGEKYIKLGQDALGNEYIKQSLRLEKDVLKYIKKELKVPVKKEQTNITQILNDLEKIEQDKMEEILKNKEQEKIIEEKKIQEQAKKELNIEEKKEAVIEEKSVTDPEKKEPVKEEKPVIIDEKKEAVKKAEEKIKAEEIIEETKIEKAEDKKILAKEEKNLKIITKIPLLRIVHDVTFYPFIFNPFEKSAGNAIAVSVYSGAVVKQFSVGGAVSYEYYSFSGMDPNTSFYGAWGILSGAARFYCKPLNFFEFDASVGAGWFASSFSYEKKGVERKDEAGVLIGTEFIFYPWQYLTIRVPLNLDLFIGNDGAYVTPYFYGSTRFDFHPYFSWLSLFVELGARVWIFNSDFFDARTALFQWSIGGAIDIDFRKTDEEFHALKKKNKK